MTFRKVGSITILLGIGFWIAWVYVKPYLGYNTNQLKVTVDQSLDVNQLSIFKGFYSINRTSDRVLFKRKSTLIFKGKNLKPLANDYGENDFLLVYADSCYFQFRHFKTNNKQRDTYRFKIFLKDNKIFLNTQIDGTDPMEFESSFKLIREIDRPKSANKSF